MRLQWQAIFKQKGFENRTSAFWVPWDPEVMKLTSRSLMFLKVRRMTVVFVGFFPSARLWCMPCDVCAAIPLLKCYFKMFFFFKIFPCVVPRLRYLSSSLFLPCCLPFYPFILSRPFSSSVGKRKTVFHLNCQTFTLKYIHSLPPHPNSSQIHIYLYFTSSLPTLSLPVLVWLSVHFSLFSDWFCSELWMWRLVECWRVVSS